MYQRITNGGNLHGYEFKERSTAVFGLGEQRYQPGADKYVMRQALRGLLPEKMRQRTDKGDFPHVFRSLISKDCSDKVIAQRMFPTYELMLRITPGNAPAVALLTSTIINY